MGESSGNDLDSTTNGIHAVPANGVIQNAVGRIGGAVQCDGVNDYLTAGPVSGKNVVDGNGTISLWVWFGDAAGITPFDTQYSTAVLMQRGGTDFSACVRSGSGTTRSGYFTGLTGAWVYMTMTLEGGTVRLYRNGTYQMEWTYTGSPLATVASLGARVDGVGQYWKGKLDEVRISAVVRSAEWLTTEYNNQTLPSDFAYGYNEERVVMGTMLLIR